MQHHEKNTNDGNTPRKNHLPNTGARFGKTIPSTVPEHTSLDFHLEMIKKIDRLLDEHEKETLVSPTFHEPPLIPPQPPTPIEPRSPLNKVFSHEEIPLKPPLEPPRTHTQTIPDEFKTELSIVPEFRFITSHEFLETISQTQPSVEDRVEVIDINSLTGEITSSPDAMTFINMKNQNDILPVSTLIREGSNKEEHTNKKIEVINVQTLTENLHKETCATENTQADQSETKAKIFFLNKKGTTDKKQKNQEMEQSYIPDDIEERLNALNEKKKKEEEQKKSLEEKERRELETEEETLNKEKEQRRSREEKKLTGFQAEQEKTKKIDNYQSKNINLDNEALISKDNSSRKTARELKNELKEQKRLQQLAIRKARIEQRQRKKKEKEMLKLHRKQELLEQKQKQKRKSESKPSDLPKNKKDESSVELDEDIRKVLVITDYLLGELPDDVLNIFLESKEFELYEKVLNKYKIK